MICHRGPARIAAPDGFHRTLLYAMWPAQAQMFTSSPTENWPSPDAHAAHE